MTTVAASVPSITELESANGGDINDDRTGSTRQWSQAGH
jgi:hypothetical protein